MGRPLNIERLFAWEILDSRGTPTVACSVTLAGGASANAAVPSGASVGRHEAHELRDGGVRYGGRGVLQAVAGLNGEIADCLRGLDASDQTLVDRTLHDLDGTSDCSRLGANATLAASVACALASAAAQHEPLWRLLSGEGPPVLPLPMINVFSGGAHAGRLIDIQDVLVVPLGASSFSEAIEWASRVRDGTAAVLRERGHQTSLVADEGGLAAPLPTNRDAVEVVATGIDRSGLVPMEQVAIAVDVAATQFQTGEHYRLASEGRSISARELIHEIRSWCALYPIVSVEDAVGEDDSEGWRLASTQLPGQLLGDDLFVTSAERLAAGIAHGVANAVLVKPNQAGTLSDAQRVVELARSANYATVLSARSGETEDIWLAELAVGWRVGQLKVGSTTRSERNAKWNYLLRLEAENRGASFVGRDVLAPLRTSQ